MERVLGQPCAPFKRAPYVARIKRRVSADRFAVQAGLGLNALVLSIILYAELFLR